MSTYLQKQIQNRLDEKKLTVNALERKAGLKRSAARNILQGFSKKPSAEILKAIANVLGCSVDDLIGSDNQGSIPHVTGLSTSGKSSYPWNEKLYIESIKSIAKILNEKELNLNFEQVIALANETYRYSMGKKSEQVDKDFMNWLISRSF